MNKIPGDAVIEDACFVRPISANGIVDWLQADNEVAKAILVKRPEPMVQALAAERAEGHVEGRAEGRVEGLAGGGGQGPARDEAAEHSRRPRRARGPCLGAGPFCGPGDERYGPSGAVVPRGAAKATESDQILV